MRQCDFNKVAKQITLSHWFSPVICCIFSEHFFRRTSLGDCFCFVTEMEYALYLELTILHFMQTNLLIDKLGN